MKTTNEQLAEELKAPQFQMNVYDRYIDGKIVGFELGFLKAIEFAHKWVSVENEMPPENEQILVKVEIGAFAERKVIGVSKFSKGRFEKFSGDWVSVTHWRLIDLKIA